MITNFEPITYELTPVELSLVPVIVQKLKFYTKDNPIKEPQIVKQFNDSGKFKKKMTGSRFRKIVNYIRSNGIIPLIATSQGYFVSTDKVEIEKQIKSMKERANSILRSANGLEKFL